MKTKNHPSAGPTRAQQAIQNNWSNEERERRRKLASRRQQTLWRLIAGSTIANIARSPAA